MKKYNILDYGAINDATTLSTVAVQSAIDDCSKNGGGEVVFPSGTFVLSTVFLKDNVKIVIPQTTVVLGSLNFNGYAPHEQIHYQLYQDASHSYFNTSMFVGVNCKNIEICGGGFIDMRSVWDEENVRNMAHRGAKCIALKNCFDVKISNVNIFNATDLAIYFAGCENVVIDKIKMRVHIDGISPDNSKNVKISNCDIETGDDGIVFKSSYTLNKLDFCKNILVNNCKIKSRCNALKFGTETNGGFYNVEIENIDIRETHISGIAIESADGAIIDGIKIQNIKMKNVQAPIFVHLSKRLRAPEGTKVGKIRNVIIENVTAEGPYLPFESIEWNYNSYINRSRIQTPWGFGGPNRFKKVGGASAEQTWQMSCNVCGLPEQPLENITLKNVKLLLDGGAKEFISEVPETPYCNYPEVHAYGYILPAKGIFFRHIKNLTFENVTVKTYREDVREDFVFVDVN